MSGKRLSKSHRLGASLMHTAFQILHENGGELNVRELMAQVGARAKLDDWAKERFEKTGNTRWQSIFHLASIKHVKSGFLIKEKGSWYLTPEGEEALGSGEHGLYHAARKGFLKWKMDNKTREVSSPDENDIEDTSDELSFDQIEQIAIDSLKRHISSKNPYEFQDLAAALLRGMGYHTPFISPKGKDGGIDIIGYRDPLGTVSPRIKVQVKHKKQPAAVHEVRQLMGLLQKDGDVGIFISSGGFTHDAKAAVRGFHIHVELIDLNRFLNLWQDFYNKLEDEDKVKLPLYPVYFLAPES